MFLRIGWNEFFRMAMWTIFKCLHLFCRDKGFIGIDSWQHLDRDDFHSNKTNNQGFNEIIWYESLFWKTTEAAEMRGISEENYSRKRHDTDWHVRWQILGKCWWRYTCLRSKSLDVITGKPEMKTTYPTWSASQGYQPIPNSASQGKTLDI